MLELVLTRPEERRRLIKAATGLQFLVLDELNTYRGRQGADVALLVRRLREACGNRDLQCIGTSATMTTVGSLEEQKKAVADVASRLFGTEVTGHEVIGETLSRATQPFDSSDEAAVAELGAAVQQTAAGGVFPRDYAEAVRSPLSSWVEGAFGLASDPVTGRLVRQAPRRLRQDAAPELSDVTGLPVQDCDDAIRRALLAGSQLMDPRAGRPLFAFRLHQFLSKGDTLYVSLEPEDTRYITSKYQVAVPSEPGEDFPVADTVPSRDSLDVPPTVGEMPTGADHGSSGPAKLLYPLAFCRECGQEYAVVKRVNGHA
jgi:ATP-dependent helicase YprA (DUF1998 family)